jgi:hypothetical protein
MRRDRHNRKAVPVGCDGHTEFLLIDERYIRWRCTDRNCPEMLAAKRRGMWLFHVFDTVTKERTNEEEPASLQG